MASILSWSKDIVEQVGSWVWSAWQGETDPHVSLADRLDAYPAGAPFNEDLMAILHVLVTPEEAKVAARIAPVPMKMSKLSNLLGMSLEEVGVIIDRLAYVGMVLDWFKTDERWVTLAPVVIGFYEFIFMRTQTTDLPLKKLADLFQSYIFGHDGEFAKSLCTPGTTVQVARPLCRESVMDIEAAHEIMDYEKASELIKSSKTIAVSNCACRHHNRLRGEHLDCNVPLETCFSLNHSADAIIRNGFGRKIEMEEALTIMGRCHDMGCVNITDNVQKSPAFLCNCCGDCCGLLTSIRDRNLTDTWVPSNFEAIVFNTDDCIECGSCIVACPINALSLGEDNKLEFPVRDDSCLGCGVCATACSQEVIVMKRRSGSPMYIPQNHLELTIAMAIERKSLHKLMFYDPLSFNHAIMRVIFKVLEYSPLGNAIRSIEALKSIALERMVKMVSPGKRRKGQARLKELKHEAEHRQSHVDLHMKGIAHDHAGHDHDKKE